MLKILDYSSWMGVYKGEIDSALRLISPENVNGLDEGSLKGVYDLPWRLALELRFLSANERYAKEMFGFSDEEIEVLYKAASRLHERVGYPTSEQPSSENVDRKQLDFASLLKMLLETPIAVLLKSVGESSVQISTHHGFTNLQLETGGKSIRAKISHHQNDPTFVYGMPEVLSKYDWACTFDGNLQSFGDSNGFQAIHSLSKLDFEEALESIVSNFTDAVANSIHNLGKFEEADARLVRINLTAQDCNFDHYLEEHYYFVQKLWMHHYLHVKLNQPSD